MPHRTATVIDDTEQTVLRRLFVGRTGKLQITPTVGVDKQTGSRLFQAWWLQVTGIAADGVMYVLQQAPGGANREFRGSQAKALQVASLILLAEQASGSFAIEVPCGMGCEQEYCPLSKGNAWSSQ